MLLGDSCTSSITCVVAFCSFAPPELLPPRNVDDVHDIMDDLQEQNEIAEEIQNAISQPIGFGVELDEVSVWECSPAPRCVLCGGIYIQLVQQDNCVCVCVGGGGVLSSLHPPFPVRVESIT